MGTCGQNKDSYAEVDQLTFDFWSGGDLRKVQNDLLPGISIESQALVFRGAHVKSKPSPSYES